MGESRSAHRTPRRWPMPSKPSLPCPHAACGAWCSGSSGVIWRSCTGTSPRPSTCASAVIPVSGFAHLFVLDRPANILDFGMSNVLFSFAWVC